MQLAEFVRATLSEIIQGASQANESLSDSGALVFPSYYEDDKGRKIYNDDHYVPTIASVSFDVAVTVSEEHGTSGGIGVAIASLGVGAKKSEGAASSSVSRVSFDIPVLFPRSKMKMP